MEWFIGFEDRVMGYEREGREPLPPT